MQQTQAIPPQNKTPPSARRRNNNVRTPWTGPRVDLLIALWAEGLGATCPQIAARLNELDGLPVTEDAVAGKIFRLGLPSKDPSLRQSQTMAAKRATRAEDRPTRKHVRTDRIVVRRKKCKPLPSYTTDNIIPLRIPFAQLANYQCRYLIGAVAELVYCGHRCDGESPWCAHHRKRCTRTG